MRAFVAVNLPGAVRSAIAEALGPVRQRAGGVRWVDTDALHITLQFLGDVQPDRVDAVGDVLAAVANDAAPFRMRLHGFGAFPSPRRPRVLWVGVDEAPELVTVQRDLEEALRPVGFTPEARPFHPHITVARAERGGRVADAAAAASLVSAVTFDAEVDVASIELMESRLQRGGAQYAVARTFPLGGGG